MKRIWYVLKREYLENVRTKAFLIGIVLTPVWMGLIFVIPLENTVMIGSIGTLSRMIGMLVAAVWLLAVVVEGELRRQVGYLPVILPGLLGVGSKVPTRQQIEVEMGLGGIFLGFL